MKSLKMKLIYRKHKKAILGTLGAVLLAGLVFFFSYFHVTKVEVMGTSRYTDEQVKEMALQGAFTDNSVLAVLLHSRVDVEGVPFVEGFYITRLSHNSICISVREKKAVGCIPYLDSYIYFDRNGIFIESSHTRDELVPFFDGIEVSHVIEGEKLPIKGNSVLTTAVALATIFQKNDAIPDHIEFDTSYQITLTYGDIRVMLGKDEYLEDKMTRVSAILPKLSGKKGILHLENVNDNSKTITFEQDLGEDGVIEDVVSLKAELKQKGIRTFAAHLKGKNSYDQEDYQGGTAFLIGNEGNGLTEEAAEAADCLIRIPMCGKVESLNAAMAAGILMYEAARQRR